MNTKDFLMGLSTDAHSYFGASKKDKGYIFRISLPGVKKVEIMGDFNDWQPQKMRAYSTGTHSISIAKAKVSDRYQYLLTSEDGSKQKIIDPYARLINPEEDCAVLTESTYKFTNKKVSNDQLNIYECHLGSLLKDDSKKEADIYKDLLSHVKASGFTHIKFMPVTEYKNYKSMGFTSIGLFAFSARYGSALDFKKFIDTCHKENIGVILDLDLAHFDDDPYYLRDLGKGHLYGYDAEDIRHSYFGDINFDPTKPLTRSYLLSLINYWTKDFNLDGIMVTNLENMVYWQGDRDRGVNDGWISLINEIIEQIKANKTLALASFNGDYDMDLGFDYVLDYRLRPLMRSVQSLPYQRDAYKKIIRDIISMDNGSKILGFSYQEAYLDESSLFMKIYGDENKYNQAKTLLTLVYSLNSKKMLFMGDDIANPRTFSVYEPIDLVNINEDQKYFYKYYKDLAKLWLANPSLNAKDSKTKILDIEGYSLYAFIREYKDSKVLVLTNFTDIDYKIPSPYDLVELLNPADLSYGDRGNINGSINKNQNIYLEPYGSAIFQIKNDGK